MRKKEKLVAIYELLVQRERRSMRHASLPLLLVLPAAVSFGPLLVLLFSAAAAAAATAVTRRGCFGNKLLP